MLRHNCTHDYMYLEHDDRSMNDLEAHRCLTTVRMIIKRSNTIELRARSASDTFKKRESGVRIGHLLHDSIDFVVVVVKVVVVAVVSNMRSHIELQHPLLA
jgi:hypothetical protein